jgi:hypothetical protein
MLLQILSVEEVADYLKLIGFDVEHDDELYAVSVSPTCKAKVGRIWSESNGVGLFIYDSAITLLDTLSKCYTVTSYMGSRYFYDITNSNSRRNI